MKKNATYSVSLVPTRIRIRKSGAHSAKRRGQAEAGVADGGFPGGESFRDFMRGFFGSHLGTATMDIDNQSGFRVSDSADGGAMVDGLFYGHVETGRFGFESELVDVTDTRRTKKRERTDCELIPFFFAMDFEPGMDCAILLTEQFGPYSPKGILLDRLRGHVEKLMPGHGVETETIVSEEVVKEVLAKRVKALRFQYQRVPPDMADSIDSDGSGHIEREGVMEIVIKSRNGVFGEWGFKLLDKVRQTGLTVSDETSTNLKVEMEYDGRTKTVDIGDFGSFNTSFPVDSREEVEANGHPATDRMLAEARDVLDICRKTLGWRTRTGHGNMGRDRRP